MSITFFAEGGRTEHLEVNMANGNACAVMQVLGIVPDYCGSIKAEELIEKINSVSSVDAGVRNPSIDIEPGHATIIDCGRTEEYLRERISQLKTLAENNLGITICWC